MVSFYTCFYNQKTFDQDWKQKKQRWDNWPPVLSKTQNAVNSRLEKYTDNAQNYM